MADIKISALPSAAAVGTSFVPVSNAAGTITNKVTLADIAALANDTRWNVFLPGAPTSVTATGGNAQASVSWTAPAGVIAQAPVTDYVVQFSSNSGASWATVSDGTSTATSATVTGLTNGVAYIFRAAAVNVVGQGPWSSASASVTPAAGNIIQTTSGLYAWYDASAENSLYSDPTGSSVVTANGGLVRKLADQSGNGRHLYAYLTDWSGNFNTGSYVPQLSTNAQNGKSVLSFDNRGGGNNLATSYRRETGSFNTGNPLTIFAVWKPLSNYQTLIRDQDYSWGDREPSSAVQIGLSADRLIMEAYSTRWVGTGTGRPGSWICQRAVMNGTNSTMVVNGSYDAPTTANGGSSSTPSAMNFALPCADFRMSGYFQLAELVFFSGAISGTTCEAIETFLMTKWGIS